MHEQMESQINTEPKDNITAEKFLKQIGDRIKYGDLTCKCIAINFLTEKLNSGEIKVSAFGNFLIFITLITKKTLENVKYKSMEICLTRFWTCIGDAIRKWTFETKIVPPIKIEIKNGDEFDTKINWFWHNIVQTSLNAIYDAIDNYEHETQLIQKMIPQFLRTLFTIEVQLYDLKTSACILKPLHDLVVNRHKKGRNILTDDWRMLIDDLEFVTDYLKYLLINYDSDSDDSLICNWDIDTDLGITIIRLFDLSLSNDTGDFRNAKLMSQRVVNELAYMRGQSLCDFYDKFRLKIFAHILTLTELKLNTDTFTVNFLRECMKVFEMDLPKELLRYLIPRIVIKCDITAQRFIRELNELNVNDDNCGEMSVIKSSLITDILCQMFFNNTKLSENAHSASKQLDELMKFLKSVKFDVKSSISTYLYAIRNEFLRHISHDYIRVLQALSFLKCFESNDENVKIKLTNFKTDEHVRVHLRPNILSYFHRTDEFIRDIQYNERLLNYENTDKLMIMKSLIKVMNIMGRDCITTFRFKLMTTLRLMISERFYKNSDIIKIGCDAFMQFIQTIDEMSLDALMPSIAASVLKLIEEYPNEAVNVLENMILIRKDKIQFHETFKLLYFIPETERLKNINNVLKRFIEYQNDPKMRDDAFRYAMVNMDNENVQIQEISLKRVLQLLKIYQSDLYQMCRGNDKGENVHQFVSTIVAKLMMVLNTNDESIMLNIAECIGQIGAIDPSRVDQHKPILSKEERSSLFINYGDVKFKADIISLLMRLINSTDQLIIQNCASYALQEILKLYHIENAKNDKLLIYPQSKLIWDSIPDDVREYCANLFNAQYRVNTKHLQREAAVFGQSPSGNVIFGSDPSMTYKIWITKWCSLLLRTFIFPNLDDELNDSNLVQREIPIEPSQSFATSSGSDFIKKLMEHLKEANVSFKMLSVCYLILNRDQSVAQFLLPFIIIAALRKSTHEKRLMIVQEIKIIIEQSFVNSNEMGYLCAQTIFNLFDYLKLWIKQRLRLLKLIAQTARNYKAALNIDKELRAVQFFLSQISWYDLANLAFKCKAYSKSLRYLEYHLSDVNPKNPEIEFQHKIGFFLQIFASLDESDFVEGCNAKRINDQSVKETILAHEVRGEVQEALSCCIKAIEAKPDDLEFREKYCTISMMGLNQIDQVYNYGHNLLEKNSEWRNNAAAHVIEASWKLGYWDELDLLLQEHGSTCIQTIGVSTGKLLSSIRGHNFDDFEKLLAFERHHYIVPLAAAAMEIRGYVRGHQSIINLHIFSDMQLVVEELYKSLDDDMIEEETVKEQLQNVIKLWDERKSLVRNVITSQEPILHTHRAIMSIIKSDERFNGFDSVTGLINKEIFKSWLNSMRLSRKVGYIQRAYTCYRDMLRAYESLYPNSLEPAELSLMITEEAKMFWAQGKDKENVVIKKLKDGIERHFHDIRNICYSNIANKEFQKSEDKSLCHINEVVDALPHDFLQQLTQSSKSSSPSLNTFSSYDSVEMLNDSELKYEKIAFSKIQLLLCKYTEELKLVSDNNLIAMFKSVTMARPKWEEGHYCLGMYYNAIVRAWEETQRNNYRFSPALGKPEEIVNLKTHLIKSLAQSLHYGVKHVHTSLPRLLTVWFDLGSEAVAVSKKSSSAKCNPKQLQNAIKYITDKTIATLMERVPSYVFFSVFDLLQSRLLHPSNEISKMIKTLVAYVVSEYPQQSMWQLIRSINSRNAKRKNCVTDIVSAAKKRIGEKKSKNENRVFFQFLTDIINVSKWLNDLCTNMCEPNGNGSASFDRNRQKNIISLKENFPKLYNYFEKKDKSQILLPFQSMVNVIMPPPSQSENPFPSNHEPFIKPVYINSIDNIVELINSLQKPRKLRIRGTDGKMYLMMAKGKDDLRKDASLIEFNNLMNRFFTRNAETRKRQLRVKTYHVIPLSDIGGLIEWLPNLTAFRAIVEKLYKNSVIHENINLNDITRNWADKVMSKEKKIEIIKTSKQKLQPSVFSQWFMENYTDPLSWFEARLAFTRTTAVFSMTGYIYGLGDRHGENILIDECSGEAVHCDFNCLFNKGEEFQYPELVPFRLTHNIINGMGPTGFEGPFRKACEHTLRVVREHKEALLNFIVPFRYDHLSEWNRSQFDDSRKSEESTNELAEKYVTNIEARIDGIPSRNISGNPRGMKQSVIGQVNHIIKEATDVENLSKMYVGWAPHL